MTNIHDRTGRDLVQIRPRGLLLEPLRLLVLADDLPVRLRVRHAVEALLEQVQGVRVAPQALQRLGAQQVPVRHAVAIDVEAKEAARRASRPDAARCALREPSAW